jgi:hypothetical protein
MGSAVVSTAVFGVPPNTSSPRRDAAILPAINPLVEDAAGSWTVVIHFRSIVKMHPVIKIIINTCCDFSGMCHVSHSLLDSLSLSRAW